MWGPLVNTILSCVAIEYGKINEQNAIEAYCKKTGECVRSCGLFLDLECASSDGLIGNDGILEMKCPKSAKNMLISEAVQKLKNFYLDKNCSLKKPIIIITRCKGNCDFAVWKPKDLLIQRIYQDEDFWHAKVFPKLKFFYEKALFHEIVDPRKSRNMAIREPGKE
ncbi:hypothetical protein ILUMI_26792 [Ignelater luminosus]|uniref:YqaJ viral recombinase domain-containing protein n=1 Tax=Ignelater luminosus TaxID=2038154 RepID=A0A8K0C5C5_IGNLU|nr:hypothetical protein ILUMI_26792 [Ignelater luminosus]